MTSQATLEAVSEVTDTTEAAITYVAPEPKNTDVDVLDRAMPFLGWLTAPLARLRQTSKHHKRSLRNLRISCELPRAG
jgi:hypothetical protein